MFLRSENVSALILLVFCLQKKEKYNKFLQLELATL